MTPEDWHYETTIAAVEETIRQIESGELDLAEVVLAFEQAAQALKACEIFLQQKRAQVDLAIEVLGETDPEEEDAF